MVPKVYYKNLHAFRFIAASLVIVSHIELFKKRLGMSNAWDHPFFFEAGSAGVDFFFVLSGFLITSLLLKEKQEKGHVDIRKFYFRRILRIWPLYYLVVLTCYLVVPYIPAFQIEGYSEHIFVDFWPKFLLSLFFLPNAALSFYESIPYAAPAWSVGVEEQFYLFWPLLLFVSRKVLRTIVLFILAFLGLKVVVVILGGILKQDTLGFESLKNFVVATRMECMGIGGLGAYCIHRNIFKNFIQSNIVCLFSLAAIPFVFANTDVFSGLHHVVFSILFLFVILNGACNHRSFIKLEHPVLHRLGNISYGLYLWHYLCVGCIVKYIAIYQDYLPDQVSLNIIIYVLVFVLTILVADISYRYFEQVFLKMKRKYSVIVSGDDARENKEVFLTSDPAIGGVIIKKDTNAPA